MARLKEATLGDFTAVVAGSNQNIADLEEVFVSITGTFVGTIATEVSFDGGLTFVVFQSDTAPALVGPLPPAGLVRSNCTAFMSGTIEARMGGRDTDRLE